MIKTSVLWNIISQTISCLRLFSNAQCFFCFFLYLCYFYLHFFPPDSLFTGKKSIRWFLSTNNEKCEPLATSVGQDKQMGHHLRVVISTWHAIRCLQVLPFSSPKTRKHSMVVLVQSDFTPWVYIACIRPQTWQVVNPMIHQPINASRCNNFHHKHKQLFWWDNARFDWPYYLPWIMIWTWNIFRTWKYTTSSPCTVGAIFRVVKMHQICLCDGNNLYLRLHTLRFAHDINKRAFKITFSWWFCKP